MPGQLYDCHNILTKQHMKPVKEGDWNYLTEDKSSCTCNHLFLCVDITEMFSILTLLVIKSKQIMYYI